MTLKQSCLMATVVIRIAPNLTNEIIDQLQDDPSSLKHCSMVAKSWRDRALKWLFENVVVKITTTDPWSYLRWLGESIPGMIRSDGALAGFTSDASFSGLHLATIHARELRLVQYASLTWITPHMLYPILSRFSAFKAITRLSLHSLSVRAFNEVDTRAIFGHFFPTVKELNLEEPRATAKSLLGFLSRFQVLDNLSISSPEWEPEDTSVALEVETVPPLRGMLHFLWFHADSATFINLLAKVPISFQSVLFVNCRLPSTPINRLLRRLSPSLKSFSASAWFNGGFKPVYPSLCS